MRSYGHTLIRRPDVRSLVVWTVVSVVWENPAWKPKVVVLCGSSIKLGNWWVDCITPRAKQPLIIKPDVLPNGLSLLILVSCYKLGFGAQIKPYGLSLLLSKEHIPELLE